jgi:hypothetical protein
MKLINKVKWVLGILLVFFLIVATNLLDRDNFRRINDSVTSIYEDRLVAKDLVFELSLLIHEKEMALAIADSQFFAQKNKAINQQIEDLILRYLNTKLTTTEARIFDDLQGNLAVLKNDEKSVMAGQMGSTGVLEGQIGKVKENLYELSKIQLEEGKRQVSISQEATATVELFTKLEIYFLIVLAILIQIIVIYKPK